MRRNLGNWDHPPPAVCRSGAEVEQQELAGEEPYCLGCLESASMAEAVAGPKLPSSGPL